MARKFLTGIDVASQRIQNVASASVGTDAPNWAQVQAWVNGLSWKNSVRAASTTSMTISAPGTTMDGVTLAANDRILLKNQSTASQNGLWVFNGSAAALTRPADYVTATDTNGNATVYVQEGTVNADTAWTCTTNGTITVDTTATTWAQIGGSGTTYTNGTGLTLTGSTFAIDTAVVVRKFAQNIGDGSTTAIAVTHSLGTLDVEVQVYEISTGATVECDVVRTNTNVVTLTFAVAPTSAQYRALVQG